MFLPHLMGNNQIDVDLQAGCSTASNNLVYIIDGSSSVGTSDFNLVKRWLVNITGSFQVSAHHTQVAVVQYSDTPHLEIPLGKHLGSQELVGAINDIVYLGGNTQTGRAIKFATQHVFPSSKRGRPARNRFAVVLTDGRSQDDVVDAALEAKAQNIILFAVGVGNEILNSELVSMANEPPSTYVLYAEGYSSIANIQGTMLQKLCQESVCPMQIPGTTNVKGFELLSRMQVDIKSKKVQGSLMSETAYLLSPRLDLTDNTSDIFPDGLPSSFVFVATVRLKSPTNHVKFDLIRVLSQDGRKQFAVTLNGLDKSVMFTSTTSTVNKQDQSIIFNNRGIKKLFDSQWHQVKLLVKPRRIVCYLDNVQIEEQLLELAVPIYIRGKTQVAKRFKTEATVPIELQKLRIYCDPEQSDKETACEISSVGFRGEKGREGPPGPDGKPGEAGIQGQKGETGLKGDHGDTGAPGLQGQPGPPGPMGPGRQLDLDTTGVSVEKGSKGEAGVQGVPGEPGLRGDTGPAGKDCILGSVGIKGEKGEDGFPGAEGHIGDPGIRGFPGQMGPAGPQGETGLTGLDGMTGPKGSQGLQGPVGPPGTSGHEGLKGARGARGLDGYPGTPGLKGAEGEPGIPGVPGDRGLPGFNGQKGVTGEPGPRGIQGERGIEGSSGTPGTNGEAGLKGNKGQNLLGLFRENLLGDWDVISYQKGVPGDTGTSGAVGSKGEVGQMGATGPRGTPGQDGIPGHSGEPGYPGKPGKLPSDEHLMKLCAAVLRNQFPQLLQTMASKTQCGQCETAKGPPGEPGLPGPSGPVGTPGYPGLTGVRGYPGQPGQVGPQGHKGDTGPTGLKGSKGVGETGTPGPPGPEGPQGPRGSDGHDVSGPPGESGKSGTPGFRRIALVTKLTTMEDYEGFFDDLNTTDPSYVVTGLVHMCPTTALNQFGARFIPTFYTINFLLSMVGNSLVLCIIYKYEKLTTVTNIFLLNLVISGVLFSSSLPFWAAYHSSQWIFGKVMCKLVGSVYFVGFYSSILFLTLLTFDRYLAVVHAITAAKRRRKLYACVSSVAVWAVSLLASVRELVLYDIRDDPKAGVLCEETGLSGDDMAKWKLLGYIQQLVVFFLLPWFMVMYCYIRITVRIMSTRMREKCRAVKLIFVIVFTFFVCWTPYNVVILLKAIQMSSRDDSKDCSNALGYAQYVTRNIAYLYCCVSPVFYTFVGKKFQSHFRRLLANRIPCLKRHLLTSQSSQTRTTSQKGGPSAMYEY
ncbi:hypothetical protein DPEC_G00064910 [Dallia pectoralis]|uniref:Uncharacterized protein n=1 Tax=Dallia pectoralis TaxID=75939 RepID=A0ACC2H7U2_DALPE|nr:hypothetical protein DPEC_G00064910 [Dallia pectoralis]